MEDSRRAFVAKTGLMAAGVAVGAAGLAVAEERPGGNSTVDRGGDKEVFNPEKFVVVSMCCYGKAVDKLNTTAFTDRLRKAARGEAVEALPPLEANAQEYKTCDGINIRDFVCIGRSK